MGKAQAPAREVHMLDTRAKPVDGPGVFTRVRAVCGVWTYPKHATTTGWKVTCPYCNPPVRRRVRIVGRPSPAAPVRDLEDA